MELVTVVRCLNTAEADLIAAELRASGIPVLLHSESSAMAEGNPLAVGGIRVQVPADQAENARQLLAD